MATLSETDDTETEPLALKVEPTPDQRLSHFSNYTSSNLGGCIATGIIEVQHRGAAADAITLLKNEAISPQWHCAYRDKNEQNSGGLY